VLITLPSKAARAAQPETSPLLADSYCCTLGVACTQTQVADCQAYMRFFNEYQDALVFGTDQVALDHAESLSRSIDGTGACVCVHVCVCVRACVRVCVCVRACVAGWLR
jgi:hypothetical protein